MEPHRRPRAAVMSMDPYHILPTDLDDEGDRGVIDARTDGRVLLRRDRTKTWTLAFAWDEIARLDNNYNRMMCIHAAPRFGGLPPGETRTRRGVICVVEGGADAAKNRIDELLDAT